MPKYRQHVLDGLNEKFNLKVIAQEKSNENGFDYADAKKINMVSNDTKSIIFNRLKYSTKIVSEIYKEKPDLILSHIDIKNLSCWLAMIMAKIIGIKYYSYGHGAYKKTNHHGLYKIIFSTAIKLHEKYICYNSYVLSDFKRFIGDKKLAYIDNTIIFNETVTPEEKENLENSILFIGRLRESSNIDMLINACAEINKTNNLELHIIGDGTISDEIKSKIKSLSFIKFHGKIFDSKKIAEISKKCKFACYPGDSGLSVVHYMSLSLPPIIHGDIKMHMGPEPSYIKNMENGIVFVRNNSESLKEKIQFAINLPKNEYINLSSNTFKMYQELCKVNFAEEFYKIVN